MGLQIQIRQIRRRSRHGSHLNPRKILGEMTPNLLEMTKVLREMEKCDLAMPPAPKQDGRPMDQNLDVHNKYYRVLGHHTDDCYMLRRDI